MAAIAAVVAAYAIGAVTNEPDAPLDLETFNASPVPTVPGPTVARVVSTPSIEQPKLTTDEDAKARSILANDARVIAVLGGVGYTVRNIGPWTRENEKIGVSIIFKPDEPVDASIDWPYIDREDGIRISRRGTATGITLMHALIDLTVKEIVVLQPVSTTSFKYME